MKNLRIGSALAAGLVIVLTGAFALSQTPSSPVDRVGTVDDGVKPADRVAVDMVRTLNDVEADTMLSRHHYLTLSELPQHRFMANKGWAIQPRNDVEGTAGDYKVVLVVTRDLKHYQLNMIPADPCKNAAVFSNDSGLIYTGQVLGCDK